MRTDILAEVKQSTSPDHSEGDEDILSMSRQGQLFTAGWREKLLMAGKLWRVTVGTVDGTGATRMTGGGAGTVIDLDQPEICIGVDAGYYLFAVEINIGLRTDIDAIDDYANIIAITDRTTAVPASMDATLVGQTETPDNLLDGGAAFPGRAYSNVLADIADPTPAEVLCYREVWGGAAGVADLFMHYEPKTPSLLAGGCAIYVYWGGFVAVGGIGSVVVGCVATSWFA